MLMVPLLNFNLQGKIFKGAFTHLYTKFVKPGNDGFTPFK